LRDDYVVAVGESVEETMVGQPDQLGPGVGIHGGGITGSDRLQRSL
jgi:hypothetical protein